MTVDQVGNTGETLLGMLDKVGRLENQPTPDIQTLEDLVSLSTRQRVEYGVQLYEAKNTEGQPYRAATFIKSDMKNAIREPEPPEHTARGVFIHTHPDTGHWSNRLFLWGKDKRPWGMLPSDLGAQDVLGNMMSGRGGDILATLSSAKLAGYLNIASSYGLTLRIGAIDDPSNQHIEDSEYEMLVGTKKGTKASAAKLAFDRRPIYDPVMVWSHRWPHGNTNYFLLLSWDKTKELTPVFTDLDNLSFGDGVDKLVQHLQLDIPHGSNLTSTPIIVVDRP